MLKMEKGNKGITLISLVVTIIVLLILAGVSIASLSGQNGILSKAQDALEKTNKEVAKEEVSMAWASCEMLYQEACSKDQSVLRDSYYTKDNMNLYLINIGEITDLYKDDILNMTIIRYKKNNIDYIFKVYNNEIMAIDKYLVDVVEIGDYVNTNIDYSNKQTFSTNSFIVSTVAPKGWRVIGKSGSGISGTVQLVSAGDPITYYMYTGVEKAINDLSNLNRTIELSTATGLGKDNFRANGFSSNNLNEVFSNGKYIDMTKGIHALSTSYCKYDNAYSNNSIDEVLEAYNTICNSNVQMDTVQGTYKLATSIMGLTINDKTADLFSNGMDTWLGGASFSDRGLWKIDSGGLMTGNAYAVYGIRPVVSLEKGVLVLNNIESNTGYASVPFEIIK